MKISKESSERKLVKVYRDTKSHIPNSDSFHLRNFNRTKEIDSTVCKTLALHTNNVGSILDSQYGPLNPI